MQILCIIKIFQIKNDDLCNWVKPTSIIKKKKGWGRERFTMIPDFENKHDKN